MKRRSVEELKELRVYLGYSVELYRLRDIAQELCDQLMVELPKISLNMEIIEKLERTILRIKGPRRSGGRPRKDDETVDEDEETPDATLIVGQTTEDIRVDEQDART